MSLQTLFLALVHWFVNCYRGRWSGGEVVLLQIISELQLEIYLLNTIWWFKQLLVMWSKWVAWYMKQVWLALGSKHMLEFCSQDGDVYSFTCLCASVRTLAGAFWKSPSPHKNAVIHSEHDESTDNLLKVVFWNKAGSGNRFDLQI